MRNSFAQMNNLSLYVGSLYYIIKENKEKTLNGAIKY